MMSEPIIELKNVNIYQGDNLILQDVNLTVNKGEFVYLVGKTGTGKSSLLKTLYGDLQLVEGEGWVVGRNLKELTWKTVPFLRRNLGVVFQDFQLLTDRNVNENMKFVLKATGWKDEKLMDEKIADVLEKVGLKTKGFKMPFELSGGEQQRMDIARALLNSPKLILADEPTGNLDGLTAVRLMEILQRSIKERMSSAAIVVSHDLSLATRFADLIVPILQESSEGDPERRTGRINMDFVLTRERDKWSAKGVPSIENVEAHLRDLYSGIERSRD